MFAERSDSVSRVETVRNPVRQVMRHRHRRFKGAWQVGRCLPVRRPEGAFSGRPKE